MSGSSEARSGVTVNEGVLSDRRRWLGYRDRVSSPRVFVLGLDCATPQLVFERYADALPTFGRLRREGAWGRLASCHPPITVPAWSCLFSGRDPGELGCYGFRNRVDHRYAAMSIASSHTVSQPRAWELASQAGLDVVVLGVPQTYPPTPVQGVMVSCFLTPSRESVFTYPPLLRLEVDRLAGGEYVLDVDDFRTDDKAGLRERIAEMTWRRFRLARAWARERPWSLFCMVEMGPDRMHHAFWRYADPAHRLYQPGSPFEDALLDYYRLLDGELAQLLEVLPDDASLFVVSDHGARAMEGGVCVNEWLLREGWLKLARAPEGVGPLRPEDVLWEETRAWGEGGYFARVWLNVEGREPCGVVPASRFEEVRAELAAGLAAIPDPEGRPLRTVVHRPEELYAVRRGVPPDLLVYFDDLAWRSIGTVGHGTIHVRGNDTGPDDANHDHQGIFLARDAALAGAGELSGLTLYDLFPTLMARLGLPCPADLRGRAL